MAFLCLQNSKRPHFKRDLEHLFGGVGLHDDTEQASALVPTNSELLGLDLAKDSGHGDERTLRDADDAATPIEVGLTREHEIGGHHRNRTVAQSFCKTIRVRSTAARREGLLDNSCMNDASDVSS